MAKQSCINSNDHNRSLFCGIRTADAAPAPKSFPGNCEGDEEGILRGDTERALEEGAGDMVRAFLVSSNTRDMTI